ncbi:T9SS type A sorting domain-containing protein [Hymenobacter sp. BT635]|uniref:T9SS type A sorting domain-containing protein n=1 Tax=Hymenobacter nitidus TaxID=2880929 RepID=A0ABS8ABQ0_9BACT|nr:M43 family zinc metalloprotease [Hymenobacter nitidus]MCB2376464.1 T9SS type A sorting domain-containing protein [Hymenobacter nitidus]
MLKHLLFLRFALLAAGIVGALATPGRAQTPAGSERAHFTPGQGFRCAFDSVQQAEFGRQPGAAARYQQFLQNAAQLSADPARLQALPDVTVPVVVHVIHTGGANNISDAQINDAMRILNEDFSKRNADTSNVIAAFQARYANVGFRFRLAKRDPSGNCTSGITRTYSTLTNIGDNQVKSLIVWDQSRYLNIWVCTSANGALAYATSPCWGGPNDGVVVKHDNLGSIGTSLGTSKALRSLTHEVGHYFGLPHTWSTALSGLPGLPAYCATDDGIADTPNTIGSLGGCNLAFSPCTDANGQPILANVQNYMDYSDCAAMFTTGQKTVMRASLQTSCRAQLTTPANLLATGTNDGFTGGPCAPVVAFEPSASKICEGGTITFNDYSYNEQPGDTRTYSWSFPGGSPATSTLRNPLVSYPVGGQYDVTLTVTSTPGGSTTRTRPQLVQVAGANTGLTAPMLESFENAGFPNNFAVPDLRNWASTSTSTAALAAWQRRANTPGGLLSSDGAACVSVRSNLLANNTVTWLTSPNINLGAFSTNSPLVLTFDRAYALRPTPVAETLQVQFSTNCGVTWTAGPTFSSAALNTMDTLRSNGFTPLQATDWKSLQIPLLPSVIGPNFLLRFQLTSQMGNPLYLDKVRIALASITSTATLAEHYGLRLFPNPATAETTVELLMPAPAAVEVRITDLLGREVLAPTSTRLAAGRQAVALPRAAQLAPGLYLVQVLTGEQTLSTKLVVR